MLFSPIAPIKVQEMINPTQFGGYHLLLAHEILAHEEAYARHYKHLHDNADIYGPTHIILDNSLWELGHPLPAAELIKAAKIVDATCIVLPDKLLSPLETIKMGVDEAERVGDLPEGMSWLGVLQGMTVRDMLCTATELHNRIPQMRYVSIPRITADKSEKHSRKPFITAYNQEFGVRNNIHLLGFSEYLRDDIESVCMRGVTGIDSAMPVWFAMQGGVLPFHLPMGNFDLGKRPQSFWDAEDINSKTIKDINVNVKRVNTWIDDVKNGVWFGHV